MTDAEYHDKSKVNDPDWRSQNGVTTKSFIDLVLDTMAPRGSEIRKELDTLDRGERRRWADVIDWADALMWFSSEPRERSPRGGPTTPPGPPGDLSSQIKPPSPDYMPTDPPAILSPSNPNWFPPGMTNITPTDTKSGREKQWMAATAAQLEKKAVALGVTWSSARPPQKSVLAKQIVEKEMATLPGASVPATSSTAPPPPPSPYVPSAPVTTMTTFKPGINSAVPPPEKLYQEVWFDSHSYEEKCLPPFSYLSHFLTVLLLGGGCQAFYSFLAGSGVSPAALEVFQSAVSESVVSAAPAASLVSRTVSAACSVIASSGQFVFKMGESLSRMSGPLLNLFYTVYPLAVLRRGKGIKSTVDSVLEDVNTVFERVVSLRHGVSAARDRRLVEMRVKLNVLKKNKQQLKNKIINFVSALKGTVKNNYNKTQGNICQALMEIYGGKRRMARIDSVEKVNVMFEKALTFNVSNYAQMVMSRRKGTPNPAATQPVPLSREQLFGPAVDASLRARNVSPKDDMEEEETAEAFLSQFIDYDASGAKRRTRRHRKQNKGKKTRIHSGRKNNKGRTRRHKNVKHRSTRKRRS